MTQASQLPERPPSEVEWEDLLVRLDIAPRAFRAALDDAADTPALRALLGRAVNEEERWTRQLDYLREGTAFPPDAGAAEGGAPPVTAREALEALAAARGRNFARLQRRGLVVWEWRAVAADGRSITAYQAALLRAQADGELIRSIRSLPRG